ncbi:MAG: pyridoxal-phosphate dependent enzyme [Sphingobacteriia bacterium]|nr:pyridoxal-phosphate dependent enzyme [Sphingobacteriia bacterium]
MVHAAGAARAGRRDFQFLQHAGRSLDRHDVAAFDFTSLGHGLSSSCSSSFGFRLHRLAEPAETFALGDGKRAGVPVDDRQRLPRGGGVAGGPAGLGVVELDARIVATPNRRDRDRLLEETVESAAAQGQAPYRVPYGGSSPTGALGYAFAMQEVLAQGIEVDWMVFATSSGATQAGLVLGQRVFGDRGTLLGISIDESASVLTSQVAALASDASAAQGARIAFDAADVHVDDRYCAPGYGVMTDRSGARGDPDLRTHRGHPAGSGLHRTCRRRSAGAHPWGLLPERCAHPVPAHRRAVGVVCRAVPQCAERNAHRACVGR